MFKNRELRNMCGFKRLKVTGDWRKFHNEELQDLYCSPDIIQVIKSRRMRWVGLATFMRKKQNAYRVWLGNMKEGDHLENLGVHGRIIFKWTVTAVQWQGVDFIHLVQDRDKLWAHVNMVINCLVP
jgi:hypothetical protein